MTEIDRDRDLGTSFQLAGGLSTTEEGLYSDARSSIATFGGGRINPLDPDPNDIDLQSLAHSLSNQCRWTGHVSSFYSVAEHCVLVSHIVPTLEALLHDGSEAYLSDLARPIKKAAGLGEVYLEVEAGLERAIAERFGFSPPPMSDEVRAADDAMLRQEAKQLLPHFGAIMSDPPLGTPKVNCWTPVEAKYEFIWRFRALGGVDG